MKNYMLILLSALLIMGCSKEETKQAEKEDPNQAITEDAETDKGDKEVGADSEHWIDQFQNVPEVAYTPEDIVNQLKGPYAEANLASSTEGYDELFAAFDTIPEDASEEELDQVFQYAVSRLAVEVPNPQELIDEWTIQLFGDPELEDTRYHFKDNYNIEIILDSSGSMANLMNGKSRMDIAKDAIKEFLKNVPENANIALRVYGHKGTGADSDKKLSCASSELVYSFNSYEDNQFTTSLNSFEPAGWTPLAQSLKDAQKDMKEFEGKSNTNMVYVVSDGVETCDGNPVEAAESFAESNIQPVINIIGFDVDGEGQKQLKEMAKEANGTYSSANDAEQLNAEFNKAKDALEKWEQWLKRANYDAGAEKNRRSLDTFAFETDFTNAMLKQNQNLEVLFTQLSNNNQITDDQREYLTEKRVELQSLTEEAADMIFKDLEEINTGKYEETKQMIKEKYNQNTN